MKHDKIVGAPWSEATLYAESIPHLFHWDLSYLWILERIGEQNELQVPPEWQDRIQAWKHLVGLFLTSEAQVEREQIKDPLLTYTAPYGVKEIAWLGVHDRRIGVLSPTVLARPLPDYQSQDREDWPQDRLKLTPNEVRHFAGKAAKHLDSLQMPFAQRLARILRDQFDSTPMSPGLAGHVIRVPLLRDVSWTQSNGTVEEKLIETEVFVQDPQGSDSTYLPRCSQCSHDLVFGMDQIIDVEGDDTAVRVECANGHENTLRLSDFLIWNRPRHPEAVVWEAGGQVGAPEKGIPPAPIIQDNVIRFSWNPAMLQSRSGPRHLALRFRNKLIREPVPIHTIFFKTLLVPGNPAAFRGIPIKAEWHDALEAALQPIQPIVEGRNESLRVEYSKVRVSGWPTMVDLVYTGPLSLRQEPDLFVGVFPNPSLMPRGWKWYRSFVHGPKQSAVTLEGLSGQVLLPWVLETIAKDPPPFTVSVDGAGASFEPSANRQETSGKIKHHFVGIDFGTTNTIAYALDSAQKNAAATPLPQEHGIRPSEMGGATQWLTGPPPPTDIVAGFLPGASYGSESGDPYLVPSALWNVGQHAFIRWSGQPPLQDAEPATNFKLDGAGDASVHEKLREQYMREVLLLLLPSILASKVPSEQPIVRLGLAFPLALTYEERRQMDTLYERVMQDLREQLGVQFELSTIDEAQACVAAFGMQNPDTSFLIADMGGGTLDIALFTTTPEKKVDYSQLGSVRFAGEAFVEAIAARTNRASWDVRDAIRSNTSNQRYGHDQKVAQALRQFNVFAFEFLRTLTLAFLQNNPAKSLQIVLVGNGWHLVTAFDPSVSQQGPRAVFRSFYEALTRDLGVKELRIYGYGKNDGSLLDKLPSTKHLVVIGALRNAANNTPKHQLNDDSQLGCLPAGRSIEIVTEHERITVDWYGMIGDGSALPIHLQRLMRGTVNINLASGPDQGNSWRERVRRTLGVSDTGRFPYPGEDQLRGAMLGPARHDTADMAILPRGPLQILLEGEWLHWMKQPYDLG